MNQYCILRATKLNSFGSVKASLSHAFRERPTPNADPDKVGNNLQVGNKSADEAFNRFKGLLPSKIRKNAVLAIEYLITASPEIMHNWNSKKQTAYFQKALDFITEKHPTGVFHAGIHRDETTPHMYIYVLPLDKNNKLNAREFLGGRAKLSQLQTDFHAAVAEFGLERGVKNSRAQHQKISNYYGKIEKLEAEIFPKKKAFENFQDYQNKCLEKIRPHLKNSFDYEDIKNQLEREQKSKISAQKKLDFWEKKSPEDFRKIASDMELKNAGTFVEYQKTLARAQQVTKPQRPKIDRSRGR